MLVNIGINPGTSYNVVSCPPDEIRDMLYVDNVGAPWPRFIKN